MCISLLYMITVCIEYIFCNPFKVTIVKLSWNYMFWQTNKVVRCACWLTWVFAVTTAAITALIIVGIIIATRAILTATVATGMSFIGYFFNIHPWVISCKEGRTSSMSIFTFTFTSHTRPPYLRF